jgi:glycosyltransferase involved in cell wall biosynthesis
MVPPDRAAVPGGTLRVCIDARLADGQGGGIQQVIVGLASGLAQLDPGPEEFLFLVAGETPAWLEPYLGERCRALVAPGEVAWKRAVRAVVPSAMIQKAWNRLDEARPVQVPFSDGTIERASVHVMHLTLQAGFRTKIPSIYMPYDLQHVHLPEMFTRRELRWRDATYRTLCGEAQAVVAISRCGREDLIQSYQLSAEKVHWVHLAPAVDAYAPLEPGERAVTRDRLALPEAFAYYPAQTWKHKNHLGLLEALAVLRDRHGLRVPLVSSGFQNDFFPVIERRARELGLAEQVRFLGFVAPRTVQALYGLCRLLVFPSRFEGFGMPVVEAFRLGVPVACSNATSLPEVVGDAAVTFDPERVDEIAEAIRRVWTDPALRGDLAERGRVRGGLFSWKETARRFRALYRHVGGRELGEHDLRTLAAMKEGPPPTGGPHDPGRPTFA